MDSIILTYINHAMLWYLSTTHTYLSAQYIYLLDDNDLLEVLREHRIDVGEWIIPMLRNPSASQDIVIKLD